NAGSAPNESGAQRTIPKWPQASNGGSLARKGSLRTLAKLNRDAPWITKHDQMVSGFGDVVAFFLCPRLLESKFIPFGVECNEGQVDDKGILIFIIRDLRSRIVVNFDHHLPTVISQESHIRR